MQRAESPQQKLRRARRCNPVSSTKLGLSAIFITVSPSDLLFWSVSGIRAEMCEQVHIASPNLTIIIISKRSIDEDGAE